ncbi:MAG: peptidylprolyl isomerase [Pseudomonadota bacterium]
MRRILRPLLALVLAGLATSAPAIEPAIRVNDSVVTDYEIAQRALLLQAFGAGGDTTALARTQLIDDRLKQDIVRRLDLVLTEDQVDAGYAEFAERRELEPQQLTQALNGRGIDEQTLRDFIEIGLSWREAVQTIFRARARPTEADLDAALEIEAGATQESVLLQELAITFEDRTEEEGTTLARRLSRELNRGGNFNSAVARYSGAPSARNGGRLDWIAAGNLPPQVRNQVLALIPGEVTAPIPVRGGLAIFKLRDIRVEPRPVQEQASDTVEFFELIQSLPADADVTAVAAAERRANEVREDVQTCVDLERVAADFDAGSGRSAPTQAGALPPGISGDLAVMEPGDTEVLRDDRGVVLLMLCGRAGEFDIETRENVRLQLFNARMNTFAQGFLQELRGSAVIIEQ